MEYLQVTLIAVLILLLLLLLLLAVWSVFSLVLTEWGDYKEAQRRHKILKG